MKKYILYAGAIAMITWLLAFPFLNAQKQYDVATYQERLETVLDVEKMPMRDANDIRRYYQLSTSDYEDALVYAKESAMDVEEIAMIQGKDKQQCDVIEQQLNARIERQKQVFAGYGTEQMDILEHAQVKRYEQTVILIIMKQQAEIIAAME